jgi:[acyl-carrier-protein] S-malonyltransferase
MEITEKVCNAPIGSLCQDGPMEELTKAVNLQPAITAINLMCWRMLEKELSGKVEFRAFAGHSLGEFSALHAAGVISTEDTIRLVAQRGALMWREGTKNPGGMRAVLGLNIEEVENYIGSCPDAANVTAANHNTDQQVVISGDIPGLDQVCARLEEAGVKVIPLNVSIANHSPLVADAVPEFARFMEGIEFARPKAPVYFNVTADEEFDTATIKEIMARQIASRVRWYETIMKMIDLGVDTFIEVGPKAVLKGMMRKIAPKDVKITSLQFDTPAGLEECVAKLL